MGFETLSGTSIQYGLISYDAHGRERPEGTQTMSTQLIQRAAHDQVTNVFVFCHGWKGDVPAAREQYDSWIGTFMRSSNVQRAAHLSPKFSPLLVGLHWPSQPWGDEELQSAAFDASSNAQPEQLLQSY